MHIRLEGDIINFRASIVDLGQHCIAVNCIESVFHVYFDDDLILTLLIGGVLSESMNHSLASSLNSTPNCFGLNSKLSLSEA